MKKQILLSKEHVHVPFLIILQSFLEIQAFKECHPDMKDPVELEIQIEDTLICILG